jgi:hypothetical protein
MVSMKMAAASAAVAAAEDDAPAIRATASTSTGVNEALTIGQVAASMARASGHVGGRP